MEETQFLEIYVWCCGCRKRKTLEESVKHDWKYCANCHQFICDECYELIEDNRCLSDKCRERNKEIKSEPIPVEKILIFSNEQTLLDSDLDRDSLIFKLFYREDFIKNTPYEAVKKDHDESSISTKEEFWKNNVFVITKRRKGKFIVWEKVF